ncbi:LolA family protein [Bartonella sp. F02]|uniref:LolA family protein n=1 Tax=Bartonella sp. F02 TaxID=2967262 RepID=UPI0022A95CAB|nr:outer membrane lipoprotein carrier protein LolA [Bartonella sp. F02]MCZ2328778.1 outer membrane lipoprotein carrier protein LolA [Bartonella sp. F02]
MEIYFFLRRGVVYFYGSIVFGVLILSSLAHASSRMERAQNVANHFAAMKTMTGDFIQFNPKGKIYEGTFYLERPGKIRFSYKGVPLQIIADGRFVGVNNRALNTWSFYPLSQTPMQFLLSNKIDLSSGHLLTLHETPGAITIILRDKTIGKGYIKMIFDAKNYALRQWTIVDSQNLETTVQIMNVRTGVRFVDYMFKIPHKNISVSHHRN